MFLLASCSGRHPDLGVVQTYLPSNGMHATSSTYNRPETYAESCVDIGNVPIILTVILKLCRPLNPDLGVVQAYPLSNGMHATNTACNYPGTYTESYLDVQHVLKESITLSSYASRRILELALLTHSRHSSLLQYQVCHATVKERRLRGASTTSTS